MESVKLAVIGAGPAGIALGVESARAGIPGVVILEKAGHICDTIASLYRQGKRVDAVYRKVAVEPRGSLSFTTMAKESFLDWMDELTAGHRLDIRHSHEVLEIRKKENGFLILCGNNAAIEADLVVIAIGIFGRPVKPSYKLAAEIKDRIHFSMPEQPPVGKELLVVGGGDSAAEAACYLSRQNHVTLSYRREEFFRINEQNLCTLNQCCNFENLATRLGADITGVAADEKRVSVCYGGKEEVVYDAIFYFLGGSTPRAFLEKAGIAYAGNKPAADQYGESNIPGLFLAGDLVAEKGTIMTAFNSAAAVIARIAEVYADRLK
ncbi:MAG: NAD(P)-binding domain-containing protein [Desulfobulbaceae bacterium]|nr:NAD(P)-binding domain-containing protein [Desulfobulbaceae bacterium]